MLGIFTTELRSGFEGDASDAGERAKHRRYAHMLCASSAMIGFTALSGACREVEGFDEARVRQEGVQAYAARLGEARERAATALETVGELFAAMGPEQADRATLQDRHLSG